MEFVIIFLLGAASGVVICANYFAMDKHRKDTKKSFFFNGDYYFTDVEFKKPETV